MFNSFLVNQTCATNLKKGDVNFAWLLYDALFPCCVFSSLFSCSNKRSADYVMTKKNLTIKECRFIEKDIRLYFLSFLFLVNSLLCDVH